LDVLFRVDKECLIPASSGVKRFVQS